MDPWPTHTEHVGGSLAILSGFGLWYRERRRGRHDANQFALELLRGERERIREQDARIDKLTLLVGELQGRLSAVTEDRDRLAAAELSRLRQ